MQVTVRVSGLSEVASRLDAFAAGAWKQGLLALVGGIVQRQTTTRIRSEKTAPSGDPWASYAASTLARKKKGDGLLVVSGRLMGSISASVAGDTAIIGTNVFYGAFHQEGTPKMPARPFLGLSAANEVEMMGAVRTFLASRFTI